MKSLFTKKFLVGFLSIGTVVVASTMRDVKSPLGKEVLSQNNTSDEQIESERGLASVEGVKVAQMYLPVVEQNIKKINGEWDVTKLTGSNHVSAFNKFQNIEDTKKSLKIKLELVGNGIVRVDGDNQLIYRVSILTDFGTIAIYKKVGDSFEIIEAKRNLSGIENQLKTADEEMDFVLERAFNQTKGNKVLTGQSISGHLSIKANLITGLSVSLHNDDGIDQNLEIDSSEIMDGGAFKYELNGEEISGVVFNNGQEGYRVSFVTGPLSGVMLNFVTNNQLEKIQETEQEIAKEEKEEVVALEVNKEANLEAPPEIAPAPIVEEAQEKALQERNEFAQKAEESGDVPLTKEEIKETVDQKGFAF